MWTRFSHGTSVPKEQQTTPNQIEYSTKVLSYLEKNIAPHKQHTKEQSSQLNSNPCPVPHSSTF